MTINNSTKCKFKNKIFKAKMKLIMKIKNSIRIKVEMRIFTIKILIFK